MKTVDQAFLDVLMQIMAEDACNYDIFLKSVLIEPYENIDSGETIKKAFGQDAVITGISAPDFQIARPGRYPFARNDKSGVLPVQGRTSRLSRFLGFYLCFYRRDIRYDPHRVESGLTHPSAIAAKGKAQGIFRLREPDLHATTGAVLHRSG
ncbi:hypothetical protein [Komagataeibacter xylinus]|nr:hypothetical protein [Komagataeibacter xylinus]